MLVFEKIGNTENSLGKVAFLVQRISILRLCPAQWNIQNGFFPNFCVRVPTYRHHSKNFSFFFGLKKSEDVDFLIKLRRTSHDCNNPFKFGVRGSKQRLLQPEVSSFPFCPQITHCTYPFYNMVLIF